MTSLEVGKRLVELCQQDKNMQAITELYAPDITSVEAMSSPEMPAEMKGLEAIEGKNKWWLDNHIVHSSSCEGPYPHGDRFVVRFKYDVTNKPMDRRFNLEEAALYTVADGKIVREEFFYSMG